MVCFLLKCSQVIFSANIAFDTKKKMSWLNPKCAHISIIPYPCQGLQFRRRFSCAINYFVDGFHFFVLALSLDPFAHAYCVLCEIILITYLHVNQNALKLLCIHVRRAANKMFFVGFSVLVWFVQCYHLAGWLALIFDVPGFTVLSLHILCCIKISYTKH